MVRFSNIEFGYRSAEAERRNRPQLLLTGFLERSNMVAQLMDGAEYLVLGYKGSGKSTISEHLSLLSNDDPNLFVDVALLKEFPFDSVPQVAGTGDGDRALRTSLGWSILLLIKLFESISKDEGAIIANPEIDRVARGLKEANLIPKRRFRDLVLASRETNFQLQLAKVFTASSKQTYVEATAQLTHIRDSLRLLICGVQTQSSHFLLIDGLDEVFSLFDETYQTIASLVHEIDSLNADFSDSEASAKIILLCRTDLFERLPSPNINKLRDYAIDLDWYQNPRRPEASDLFKLATHRARMQGYSGTNVVLDFFPRTLARSNGASPVDTLTFLLDHTRHTPRDFLQLLYHVQQEAKRRPLNAQTVFDGLRHYSINYFLPELKDELAGYLTPDQTEACLRLVGGIRKREFGIVELEEYAEQSRTQIDWDLRQALRVLFDCSAIGNVTSRPREGGRGVFYTFRFRNRNAAINYSERLMLHRGAWKALNIA